MYTVEYRTRLLDVSEEAIQTDHFGFAEEVSGEAMDNELGMDFHKRRDGVAETQERETWVSGD